MELEENFNIQEKNRELLQQLKASEEMLRQEREDKAALQREYDTMRAKFEPKAETSLLSGDIEREAKDEIQRSFQEKIRKFF